MNDLFWNKSNYINEHMLILWALVYVVNNMHHDIMVMDGQQSKPAAKDPFIVLIENIVKHPEKYEEDSVWIWLWVYW